MIANTGDDIEIYGAHVSPDPDLITFWLADRIDERGWGLRGRHVPRDGRPARARRRGLVQPRRPRPRDRPAPRAEALRAGARLTDAHGGARRGPRRPGARAADERRAGAHPRARPGRWWPLPGVHDPRPRRRARSRASSSAALAPPAPTPEVLTRSPTRRRDRHRPLEPGDLDRPDPGGARASARRSADARAPVVAVSPLVGGEVLKGPTAAFMALGRAAARRATGSRPTTTALIDGLVADERGRAACPCSRPTCCMTTPPRRAARVAEETLDVRARAATAHELATFAADARPLAILPIKSFADAKQRLADELTPTAPRGRWPRRCSPTCWSRCGASRRSSEILVVTGDRGAQRIAGGYGATSCSTTTSAGHNAAAAPASRRALEARRRARAAGPRRLPAADPRSSTRCSTAPAGGARS